ncbi:hypothetical protein LCGC14_0481520 [marine sediment metagenome]|uniref:Uncharacterized protein n=1 Tax=marine sediment metagenome TaxID=412755 RepID=A0A0F9SSC5_9ZZZZ
MTRGDRENSLMMTIKTSEHDCYVLCAKAPKGNVGAFKSQLGSDPIWIEQDICNAPKIPTIVGECFLDASLIHCAGWNLEKSIYLHHAFDTEKDKWEAIDEEIADIPDLEYVWLSIRVLHNGDLLAVYPGARITKESGFI